ncbi:MAG: SH3 domain-containing protein, partial [Desulfobacterota bacterium]|nr:SH3 domain-containing protein [Thermodesulfobacteriota bacterium]
MQRRSLHLSEVKTLKREWPREEILTYLEEDWKEFGKSEKPRYGEDGRPLPDAFWQSLKENIYHHGLKERNSLLYALTIRRTNIRVFPTEKPSFPSPTNLEVDLFQHSAISPSFPVGIYYFSRDHLWAYGQTPFIRGWIQTQDLAFAKNKDELFDHGGLKEFLMITGSFVKIYADPRFQ